MERKAYFAAMRLHSPAKFSAWIENYRQANREKIRKQTRLRVARFRARKA